MRIFFLTLFVSITMILSAAAWDGQMARFTRIGPEDGLSQVTVSSEKAADMLTHARLSALAALVEEFRFDILQEAFEEKE